MLRNMLIRLDDIIAYFKNYYETRKADGLVVEKPNSIYAKGGYSDADVRRNILSNPFKRFEDMQSFIIPRPSVSFRLSLRFGST